MVVATRPPVHLLQMMSTTRRAWQHRLAGVQSTRPRLVILKDLYHQSILDHRVAVHQVIDHRVAVHQVRDRMLRLKTTMMLMMAPARRLARILMMKMKMKRR
jgi:hypothetical protein